MSTLYQNSKKREQSAPLWFSQPRNQNQSIQVNWHSAWGVHWQIESIDSTCAHATHYDVAGHVVFHCCVAVWCSVLQCVVVRVAMCRLVTVTWQVTSPDSKSCHTHNVTSHTSSHVTKSNHVRHATHTKSCHTHQVMSHTHQAMSHTWSTHLCRVLCNNLVLRIAYV